MQEVGGKKNLFQSATYIFLQNLLLQTGSIWRAEETWQRILTNLQERQITMAGRKNKKERKREEEKKKRERQRSFKCSKSA